MSEPKPKKIYRGIAVFAVLEIAIIVNDRIANKSYAWPRVLIGALLVGLAVYITTKIVDYLYDTTHKKP